MTTLSLSVYFLSVTAAIGCYVLVARSMLASWPCRSDQIPRQATSGKYCAHANILHTKTSRQRQKNSYFSSLPAASEFFCPLRRAINDGCHIIYQSNRCLTMNVGSMSNEANSAAVPSPDAALSGNNNSEAGSSLSSLEAMAIVLPKVRNQERLLLGTRTRQ